MRPHCRGIAVGQGKLLDVNERRCRSSWPEARVPPTVRVPDIVVAERWTSRTTSRRLRRAQLRPQRVRRRPRHGLHRARPASCSDFSQHLSSDSGSRSANPRSCASKRPPSPATGAVNARTSLLSPTSPQCSKKPGANGDAVASTRFSRQRCLISDSSRQARFGGSVHAIAAVRVGLIAYVCCRETPASV